MTQYLSVLVPIPITAAMLISTNAPASPYPAWANNTTFAKGAFCYSATTQRVYQSLVDGNLNHDPTDPNNQFGAVVYWQDVNPTNPMAMFDGDVSTQTAVATPLTVTLQPGPFSDGYMAGLDADQARVIVKDAQGGNVIFDTTYQLEGSAPAEWDEWCFDPFKPLSDLLFGGIEPYASAEATVTISKGSGTVKCGLLALGAMKALGQTQRGAKAKPKTYSYIKTDDFGNTKIVRRKATTDVSMSAILSREESDDALATVQSVLDVPAVWIGANLPGYAGLRVFGLGSGELSYDSPGYDTLSINVQGVIRTT
jgi:hypothetical protein